MSAVLVAWRNRWTTGIRLLAPLLFLALALVVQEALEANARRTGRIRDAPTSVPVPTSSIPNCHTELFIHDKPCLDFIYTPNNDTTIKVCLTASVMRAKGQSQIQWSLGLYKTEQ